MNRSDIPQLIDALCSGEENAYHTLLEAGRDVIPDLIAQLATRVDGGHRARIIEVIWQQRDQVVIPFLASALYDEHPEVWKQALDGLITIGGPKSRNALNDCLVQISPDDHRFDWVTEAICQLKK